MKINQRGLIAFAVIVVLKVVIRVFGALGFYTIPTPAMEPTIKTGQYIITTNLFGYNRGDIVIFKYPVPGFDDIYNKRLCAIEGDEVAEKYGFEKSIMPDGDFVEEVVGNGDKDNFGPTTVPKEMMLMLGDSRDNSFDSRFWGFCPVENFRGKVIGIF